ncbi:MAG TPA: four helix bundle protein [Flavipsychrobacter sp.]|nr:four helix bundle protein [Flavipsychrobacter sp.]
MFRELTAYKKAFQLAMEIFQVTKKFPKEETYSLTDQIRRSSRSVFANIAEAYRKRRYPAHFVSKISDADMENTETQVWIDFATSCEYLQSDTRIQLLSLSEEVGKLLQHMINNPERFLPTQQKKT